MVTVTTYYCPVNCVEHTAKSSKTFRFEAKPRTAPYGNVVNFSLYRCNKISIERTKKAVGFPALLVPKFDMRFGIDNVN